jgi:hypothetical protein
MQGLRGREAGALVAMVSVTLMAAFGGPARGADGFGFDLVVNLTPRAAEALKLAREGVVVSAWYYADPKPGATNVNPVGLIDLAVEERELASFAGTLRVGGEGVDTMALGEIGGPVAEDWLLGILRQAVADRIIVALVVDEDVQRELEAGRRVEGAHRDGYPVLAERVPEQERAAGPAEAAARLVRGLVPAQGVAAVQSERGARRLGRGPEVAGLPAALRAVAGGGRAQRPGQLEADRAAEAGAVDRHVRCSSGLARRFTAAA